MSIKKPSYVNGDDVIATKSGWCYTPNHNEVLVAIPHLDKRLDQPDVPEPEVPVEPEPETEPEEPVTDPESDPETSE